VYNLFGGVLLVALGPALVKEGGEILKSSRGLARRKTELGEVVGMVR
jgi:hypothetical protein